MKQPKQSSQSDTKSSTKPAHRESPAVLFDLDGTLIDSNYQHVNAWSEALLAADIVIPRWKIHRRVGMSGKSMLQELLREIPRGKRKIDLDQLEKQHDRNFRRTVPHLQPLPGANELLAHLFRHKIRIAIATTGGKAATTLLLRRLKLPPQMPVLTGDDVKKAKPSPDIFEEAAHRLDVEINNCIVVGDSEWDLLAAVRKSALGVGFLSGGYAQAELERAGAFRVYSDAADMLMHIEQLGLPGR
jgi:HAD superfamily hydrolase (TIGR01509 family)